MKKFLNILKIIGVVLLVAVISFAGFTMYRYFYRVAPEQEGSFSFASGTMPVDRNFYVISGEITGAPTGIIRQEQSQKGTFMGLGDLMYGTLAGDKTGGKVIIRFQLTDYRGEPDMSDAAKELFEYAASHPGTEYFAKFVDTKANMVMPGDRLKRSAGSRPKRWGPCLTPIHCDRLGLPMSLISVNCERLVSRSSSRMFC